MIAGRKLLLIDDSPAIQKVIDLTFTDEGMQVTTVGDGRQALEELERVAPDVVLADVLMPGVDGYRICESIKQDERFAGIPVMLLVGSFEPFDKAEARRVGADDVVTKPFQSIRQLVNRVGSLLGGKPPDLEESAHQYATLGIGWTESSSEAAETTNTHNQPNVKVFVEAPMMESLESEDMHEKTCEPDIEMQTADTMRLHRVDVDLTTAETEPMTNLQQSEIKSAPVLGGQQISQPGDDAVLDLGEVDRLAPAVTAESFVLDLEDEDPTHVSEPISVAPIAESPAPVEEVVADETVADEAPQELQAVPSTVESNAEPAIIEDNPAISTPPQINLSELSPETIEAIARRAIEHLSERVVREIAWEVVPELAELLIKQKLEEPH